MARLKRTRMLLSLAAVVGAMAVSSHASGGALALYDNFTNPAINPDKWIGAESFTGNVNPNAEAKRFIERGKLRIVLTTYGDIASDSGDRAGRFGLGFANPGPITAIQASATIKQASSEDCVDNTAVGRARAHIIGSFFNDGSSTGTNDRTGDILGSFQKHIDKNGRKFAASISRCPNANCTPASTILTSITFETEWTLGVPDTLKIEWDPVGNRFLFTLNPGMADEEAHPLSYAQSNDDPPALDFKQIRAQNTGPNCTTGRTRAFMDLLFDNVKLNPASLP